MNKWLSAFEVFAVAAVPAALFLCSIHDIEYTAVITLVVVVLAIVPFFLRFEKQKPLPHQFMHIIILSAIAVVGRIVCAPFLSIQPVTAVVIVTGLCYGRQSGFMTGATAALVSNMFFGQGPWTPWQMYAWGLAGYLSGIIGNAGLLKKNVFVYIFGFASSMMYGFMLDSWHVSAYVSPITWQTALAGYAAGLGPNLVHAVSTSAFLVLILVPWRKKLERIKIKFDIKNV